MGEWLDWNAGKDVFEDVFGDPPPDPNLKVEIKYKSGVPRISLFYTVNWESSYIEKYRFISMDDTTCALRQSSFPVTPQGDLRVDVQPEDGYISDTIRPEDISSAFKEKPLKDSNPKKQFGDKSIPLNLWPALASSYGALGLYNGKLKYGQSNFNATPVEASIYIAGAMRHLAAWSEGEEFDPRDGVPNLGGVLANIAIILEARASGTLIDDRKLGNGYLKERECLKNIIANLQELHKDKSPKHYYLKDKR